MNPGWAEKGSPLIDSDHTLRNRVARLLQLASEARATGRHAAADQLTARAAELLDKIVRDASVKSCDQSGMRLLYTPESSRFNDFVLRGLQDDPRHRC
jgi:hypothetical protein